MIETYASPVKSTRLLRHNIDQLLKARGQTRHDLAFWCRRTDAWISKILSEKEDDQARGVPLKYLDRIADFFGIATYQLFQPGISALTERRKSGERRKYTDRRISRAFPSVNGPSDADLLRRLQLLTPKEREKIDGWIDVLRLGRVDERNLEVPRDPRESKTSAGSTTPRTRQPRPQEDATPKRRDA